MRRSLPHAFRAGGRNFKKATFTLLPQTLSRLRQAKEETGRSYGEIIDAAVKAYLETGPS